MDQSLKLDILAIVAHPDDLELAGSGTVVKAIRAGKKVGILDLTRGEMSTRGTAEIRAAEAARATEIMGLHVRENAELPDGFIADTREQQLAIIPFIRKYRPDIVIANALEDRHPDHGAAAALTARACFLSGLSALKTESSDGSNSAWRPRAVYHMIQDRYLKPDFVVDISDTWGTKLEAIRAFSSQFFTGEKDDQPQTPISTPDFMKFLEARAREMGRLIFVEYGEGFNVQRPVGVNDITALT